MKNYLIGINETPDDKGPVCWCDIQVEFSVDFIMSVLVYPYMEYHKIIQYATDIDHTRGNGQLCNYANQLEAHTAKIIKIATVSQPLFDCWKTLFSSIVLISTIMVSD